MATGEGPGTEGGATGEAAEGFGGNISGPDTNGGDGSGMDAHEWGGKVADNISANIAQAKAATTNYNAPAAAQSIDHWDTQDKESDAYSPPAALSAVNKGFTLGDESTYAAYEDAKAYSDKGWAPGQALTYTDEQGKTQLATLEAHENRMELSELEALRQQAYAAKNAKTGWDVPFLGNVSTDQIAQQAMAAVGGVTTGIGSAFLGMISQPYSETLSGTAAQRAALGYHGPGIPTGMPNVGPFMSEEDRNWDDARWGDNFDPTVGRPAPVTRDSQGNITVQVAGGANPPTSPAGGEQITVAAPPGAPDQRVTQFKALYPAEWTETLTDEEIIAMVENPDQLRYWLSWRQT
jgi:hypothetical protein